MDIFEWNENIPVTANNLNEMQNILNDNVTNEFQTKGEILWQNSDTSSSFEPQSITLENNDCDMCLWIFRRTNSTNQLVSMMIINRYDFVITSITLGGDTVRRGCSYSGNNIYAIGEGTVGASTTNNQWLIPLCVVGFNTGLF